MVPELPQRSAPLCGDRGSVVGAAVADHDDEKLRSASVPEDPVEQPADDGLFVEGGDHDRDRVCLGRHACCGGPIRLDRRGSLRPT